MSAIAIEIMEGLAREASPKELLVMLMGALALDAAPASQMRVLHLLRGQPFSPERFLHRQLQQVCW